MKSYQVIRTHLSPYQASNFVDLEKRTLEALGVQYRPLNEAKSGMETILITNTHTQLKDLPADLLTQTKLIIHPNSGYDHFADEYHLWSKIPLAIGHTIRAQAVAEYTLASLFEGVSQLPQHLSWDKERKWDRKLIGDMSVWVYGYGHIGKKVADTLKNLGAKVTVIDPYVSDCPHPRLKHWSAGNLRSADAHLICCSLNESTQHLFNQDFFQNVHPEIFIVNGARGKIIDSAALKEFLSRHPRSFAYLDVFEKEPFEEGWVSLPHVWKTSHIAGVSHNLDQKILTFEVDILKDYLSLTEGEFKKKHLGILLQTKFVKGVLL